MPQTYTTDLAKVAELLYGDIQRDKIEHSVPVLDQNTGAFTGQYYDDRGPVPEGQPNTQRTKEYLSFLYQKHGGYFVPDVGRPLPGFDHKDIYESEGFLDSIGNVLSAAYDESLTGMADKAITGKDRFDVSHWKPSTLEKIGTQVASFFMPLDLAVLVAGEGVGGAVAKEVMAKAISKAVAKKVLSGMGKFAARKSVGRIVANVARSAGGLAAYSGTGEALRQKVSGEEADFLKIFKESAKGTALGALMGVTGAMVPKKFGKIGEEIGQAGAGVAVLGGAGPLLEGQMPSFKSFGDAAKFIVGLRLAQGAIHLPTKAKKAIAIRNLERKLEKTGLSTEEAVYKEMGLEPPEGNRGTEKKIDVEKKAKFQKQFAREVKSKGGKPILRMVNPPKSATFKEQYGHYRQALKLAKEKNARLYLGKTDTKLLKTLRKRGLVSEKPAGKGGYYAITPGVKKSNLEILKKAHDQKIIDPGTYRIARELITADPTFEARDVIKISKKVAPAEIIRQAGGDPEKNIVGGRTISDATRTIIQLYKGADAKTVVHEWYHRAYYRLPKDIKKKYTEYYKTLDKESRKKTADEHFASEGSTYFFSEKLRTESGVLKKYFKKMRDYLVDLVGKVRTIRQAKIPKEIIDIYRKAALKNKVEARRKMNVFTEQKVKREKLNKGDIQLTEKEALPNMEKKPLALIKLQKKLGTLPPKDAPFQLREKVSHQVRIKNKVASKKVGAIEVFRQMVSALTPDIAKQMGSRLKSEPAHEFKSLLLSADNRAHYYSGTFLEKFAKAGIGGKKVISGNDIMKGKYPEISAIFEEIWGSLSKAGKKIGKIKNYFPRVLKDDIRQKLWDDVKAIELELKAMESSGIEIGKQDKAVASMLRKKSKPLKEAIGHIIKSGKAKNIVDALSKLSKELKIDPFRKSSFEYKRRLDLPSHFYENNARKVIPKYVQDASRQLAMAEIFGVNPKTGRTGTKILNVLDKLKSEDYEEFKIALKALSMWTGAYEASHGFVGKARKMADLYTSIEFGTKIALGRATLLNLAQPAISMIPDLGVFNTIRGGIELLNPKVREGIRKSGAINPYMMESMLGYTPDGTFGKLSQKFAKASGFVGVNKGLAYLAASTFRVAAKGWHEIAKGKGLRAKWARERLKDFGLDYKKPIPEKKMIEGMYRFATDSQLQKNILKDPIIFNEPKWRPFFLFKRFGYRQFTYIKDLLIKEASRGNYLPMIRLAAAGFVGGEMIHFGVNLIQSLLSGEPAYRKESLEHEPFKRLISDIAIIGAFGAIGDIMDIDKMSKLSSWAKFTVYPVVVSDAENIMNAYTKFAGDWERYGDGWLATKRNAYNVFGFLGSYPRYLGKRLYTKPQKERRVRYLKGVERTEILDLLLHGHGEAASDRVAKWNQHYPKYPLTHGDVSLSALRKYLKAKLKKAIDAQGDISAEEKRKMYRKLNIEIKNSARI